MKPTYLLIIFLPFMLWLAGCEQTRPGVIKNLIFSEGDQWLERDVQEDPYELVEGQCCNDYNPCPLPIDTTIYPVIAPAGDLDYFDLQITADSVGQLLLRSERDNITMRIFSRDLEEYEFLLDTLEVSLSGTEYWTTVYGPLDSLTVLVMGDSKKAQGDYHLEWRSVVPVTYLLIDEPDGGDHWMSREENTISWQVQSVIESRPVSVALLKGPVVVEVLIREQYYVNRLRWTPDEDLESGNDYRIMVYLSDDPTTLVISDAFEID